MTTFLEFTKQKGVQTDWWANSVLTNQLLVELVNEMHDNKVAICHARHVILAVQTCHRQLKGSLGRAWDCLRAWQLSVPTWSRIPMPLLILRSMFATALLFALDEPTVHWYVFAVLLRLGHAGLLRPIELMKLTAEDIRLPQSQWEPQVAVLRLVEPKNKSCLGRYQFTTINDPDLVLWLGWLTQGMIPHARLWPGSQPLFTKYFKRVLRRLGYERLGISPASLRPGGATAHFMQHQNIAALRIAGRWRAESSLEHYIQLVMSHLCVCSLTDTEHEYASDLAQATLAQWQRPPSKPWSAIFSRARQCQGLAVAQQRRSSLQSSGISQTTCKLPAATTSLP